MNLSLYKGVSRLSRRFFLTYVFTVVCLALMAAITLPAHAIAPWETAYSSNRNGHFQIFRNDGYGASPVPDTALTNSTGYDDTHPTFHPFFGNIHGGRIAFQRTATSGGNSEIYVVDFKPDFTVYATYSITSGITGSKSAPTWSPDGYKLAFVVDNGTSKEVYVASVNNAYTPGLAPHTLAQCSLGSPSALTSGGSNEEPMWLYDGHPGVSTYINGHYYTLGTDQGIAYVHRDSSGNGDIYKIASSGGTAVNMTAAGDPNNIYDDVHPNITTFGTKYGEISFTSNRGSGGAQEIYKTDGSATTAQTTLNTTGTGYWSAYSAYHQGGSVQYVGGVEQDSDLVLFISHRAIEIDSTMVDATNLYVYHADHSVAPSPRTRDGAGVINKELVNVLIFAEADEETTGPIGFGGLSGPG